LLGLYIGIDATLEDQNLAATAKLEAVEAAFKDAARWWSTATRIVAVNVFVFSFAQYPNRLFWMPGSVRAKFEATARRLISPISWSALGVFSHLARTFGLRVSLRDLRLANAAAIITTYATVPGCEEAIGPALRHLRPDRCNQLTAAGRLVHPAESWLAAAGFVRTVTGRSSGQLWTAVGAKAGKAGGESARLYAHLLTKETPIWERYLRGRLMARGWDGDRFVAGLRTLPRSTPQAHRWHLLKAALNGHLTGQRLRDVHSTTTTSGTAGGTPCHACLYCGAAHKDSVGHLWKCRTVRAAVEQLVATASPAGAPLLPRLHVWEEADMLFQRRPMSGDERALLLATFSALWSLRRTLRRGYTVGDGRALAALLARGIQCPWLEASMPSTTRQERRAARARVAPLPHPGAVLYRSDGASRGQGTDGAGTGAAGFGAAVWPASADGQGTGPPEATLLGDLGPMTNNMAEYAGLHACMTRALARAHVDHRVVFQVDSMLLAAHMARRRPARATATLRAWYSQCRELGIELVRRKVAWAVVHIYREHNCTADSLANSGVDLGSPGSTQASVAW